MTLRRISFFVIGHPKGASRPRARSMPLHDRTGRPVLNGRGEKIWTARAYQEKPESWVSAIRCTAIKYVPSEPIVGPCRVDCTWVFQRPDSHFGTGKNEGKLRANAPHWHIQTPDRDNLDKTLLDTLTELQFWKNDNVACSGLLNRIWAPLGTNSGALITIQELADVVELAELALEHDDAIPIDQIEFEAFKAAARDSKNRADNSTVQTAP
jgi:Holliday junction resolvase RusA-like endonuclease